MDKAVYTADILDIPCLTLCMLDFLCFCCRLLTFFKLFFFSRNISGTLSECQAVCIYSDDPLKMGPNQML